MKLELLWMNVKKLGFKYTYNILDVYTAILEYMQCTIIFAVLTDDGSWLYFNGYCSNNSLGLSSDRADVIVYFYYVIYLYTVRSEVDRLNGILIIQYIKSRRKTLNCCLRDCFQ
jgi:hypothetical protein